MHHSDQGLEMLLDVGGRHEHPVVVANLTFVRLKTPGKDVDNGALPGAVLADQAMHFARMHNQVDSVDGQLATEMLGDLPHFEGIGPYGLCHVRWGPPGSRRRRSTDGEPRRGRAHQLANNCLVIAEVEPLG